MTRSKFAVWASVFLVAGLMTLAVGTACAQGGGGGRGGRGGMNNMSYLDRSWTAVCFGVEATQEQIMALVPTFTEQWKVRVDTMKTIADAPDRRAAMQAAQPTFAKIQTDIDAKLKEILSADQVTKITAMLAPPQGPMGGPGGAGGPGGGGGGGGAQG